MENSGESLPVRECGLKLEVDAIGVKFVPVTPCAGVWIEIEDAAGNLQTQIGHSLCGSVD